MLLLDNMYATPGMPEDLDGASGMTCIGCNLQDGTMSAGSSLFSPVDKGLLAMAGAAVLTGLVTSFTEQRTVAKIGAGIGVAGALALLALAATRTAAGMDYANGRASTSAVLAHMTAAEIIAAGALMATSAVALLVAGRS